MPADHALNLQEFLHRLKPGEKLAGCYLLQRAVDGTARPIWLAHDEVLGKDISLHFLPLSLLQEEGVGDRLRQEIKRARQLIHPRILRVYDLIEEDDWAAVAMDTFASQPLSMVLAANPHGCFEVPDVWPLVRELAETLDEAHRIRLTHGALSPNDVLVGGGKLKVMNFGVSHCLIEAMHDDSSKASFSPQQLSGNKPTASDDIYAFGGLLHTLLVGRPPFAGLDRSTTAPSVSQHRGELNRTGAAIPAEWENAIAACLAPEPANRPATCVEIADRLERAASDAPLSGGSPVTEVAPAAPAPTAAATVETSAEPAEPKLEAQPVATEVPVLAPALPAEVAPSEPPTTPADPTNVPSESKSEEAPLKLETESAAAASPESTSTSSADQAASTKSETSTSSAADRQDLVDAVRSDEVSDAAKKRSSPSRPEPTSAFDEEDGPSGKAIVVTLGVIGVIGVFVYRTFFGEAESGTRKPEPTPEPALVSSTPVPSTPIAKVETATPAPSTPKPATPEPAAPAVASMTPAPTTPAPANEPSADNEAITSIKKAIEQLTTEQTRLQNEYTRADEGAREAEKVATEKRAAAENARKAAATAALQLAARRTELAEAEKNPKPKAASPSPAPGGKNATTAKGAATPSPAPEAPLPVKSEPNATPKPGVKPIADDPKTAFEQKMKELSSALDSKATPAPASPAPKVETPTTMAKLATPQPAGSASTPAPDASAKKAEPGLVNSLGMKLLPLPDSEGDLIAIWPTRVRDYEAYAKSAAIKGGQWKDPGYKQGPDHPVVNVSWQDAISFCKWLTAKEQKEGVISAKQSYRLPTDLEWSHAAGLPKETGNTPESRDMGVSDVYPWGNAWPPPHGAGNYTGEETQSDVAIKGYNDGFPWTSPVGSFPANKFGLFDMGGNVWQWCMDAWNTESKAKVLRGASWYNGALKLSLLTSCRVHASPDSSTDNYGFRVVLAGETNKTSKK